MSADDGERCDELVRAVLAPLVLGGPVHAVRPFGAKLGLRIGVERSLLDLDLRVRLDVARVRRARLLAPVDALNPIDEGSFAMLAALNDILQVTNHHLASALTRGRYARLMASIAWLCERIPAPRDLLDALSRHGTFARALELSRSDAKVSWWTGSSSFRGEPPPARLIAWRELRQVHVETRLIPLSEMAGGLVGVSPGAYTDVVALWLTRSPLTDLATVARRSPPFAWSASTLSLVASRPGRSLAFRAVSREPVAAVIAALVAAEAAIPPIHVEARALAGEFLREVREGMRKLDRPTAG